MNCVRNNQLNSGSPDPENDPEDEKNEISNSAMILQKGLQSLENPVLRGSFTLVLTTKDLHFFDEIAKQAFQEIINYGFYNVACNSPDLNTIHLTTDQGKVQNKRPGVYVILNIQNRKCIVGQTKNLKKRFNQYTSRSTGIFSKTDKINQNFYIEVQQNLQNSLDYSQVFQRFVVYTWVDEKKKHLI